MNMSEEQKITLIAEKISAQYTSNVKDDLIRTFDDKLNRFLNDLKDHQKQILDSMLVMINATIDKRVSDTEHKFDKRIDNINTHRDGIYKTLESAQVNCKREQTKEMEYLKQNDTKLEKRIDGQDIQFVEVGKQLAELNRIVWLLGRIGGFLSFCLVVASLLIAYFR